MKKRCFRKKLCCSAVALFSLFIVCGNALHAGETTDGNNNGAIIISGKSTSATESEITFLPGAFSSMAGFPKVESVENGSLMVISDMGAKQEFFVLLGWHTTMMPLVMNVAYENMVTSTPSFYPVGDTLEVKDHMTLYAVWAIDQNKDGIPDYGGSIIKPSSGSVNARIGIDTREEATGNEAITGTRVWTYGNTLYIQTEKAVRANIYTINGTLFKQIHATEGLNTETLNRGIYIVEMEGKRHKVIIQ